MKKTKKLKSKKSQTRDVVKSKSAVKRQLAEVVVDVYLEDQANEDYYAYGVAVIEDRAIFGSIDGLKPVIRRALWSTYKLGLTNRSKADKSAKIVGDVLGNYHPHGDMAAYGAIVNAANSPQKLIQGEGNWGTMTDPPAAYRYTCAKLSRYSDLVFFDKFYLPVIEYVPNYDGSKDEPLILPTLLPNTILNGNFGITPGVQTRTPSYTLKSVLAVLEEAFTEGKCTPEMCLKLDFTTKYGGVVYKTKAQKKELLEFYRTGKGKVTVESVASQPNAKNEIRIDAFAPIANLEKTLTKVENIKGVIGTRDDGDKSDRYQKAYVISLAKNLKGALRDEVIRKVMTAFSADVSYSVQATERYVKENGEAAARLFATTVPELIQLWMDYRIELERKACTYWINKRKEELDDLHLLRLAVKMRDIILKALGKDMDDDKLAEYLAKQLKITVVQANRILDLKVRQLRALEDKKLVARIKELEEESKTYEMRKRKPTSYILKHLKQLEKELING